MKVILLDELKGRGGEGDVIDVATGYAVNFLFPKKLAISATKGNLKQLELRKHNIAKREANRLDSADKLLAALEGLSVRVGAKVGEEGQLFGSVTPIQVAQALSEKLGTEIDRKRVDLHGLIKTAGEHQATVSIYREVKATITVEVVDEKTLLAAPAAEEAAEVEAAEAAEAAEAEAEVAEEVAELVEAVEEAVEEAIEEAIVEEIVEETVEEIVDEIVAEDLAEEATEIAKVVDEIEGDLDAAVADAAAAEVEEKLTESGNTED
jgi:large subunit ribosomal protein L9